MITCDKCNFNIADHPSINCHCTDPIDFIDSETGELCCRYNDNAVESDKEDIITCSICDWMGTTEDILVADHPFKSGYVCYGCPKCFAIERFK